MVRYARLSTCVEFKGRRIHKRILLPETPMHGSLWVRANMSKSIKRIFDRLTYAYK